VLEADAGADEAVPEVRLDAVERLQLGVHRDGLGAALPRTIGVSPTVLGMESSGSRWLVISAASVVGASSYESSGGSGRNPPLLAHQKTKVDAPLSRNERSE
jgi:hypothetical protein